MTPPSRRWPCTSTPSAAVKSDQGNPDLFKGPGCSEAGASGLPV
jgi:hypothetical protein